MCIVQGLPAEGMLLGTSRKNPKTVAPLENCTGCANGKSGLNWSDDGRWAIANQVKIVSLLENRKGRTL